MSKKIKKRKDLFWLDVSRAVHLICEGGSNNILHWSGEEVEGKRMRRGQSDRYTEVIEY